ncbi:MAG: hypothetical protein RIS70_689 [Planctomycetota bacterium]|jgi:hypothetical protein
MHPGDSNTPPLLKRPWRFVISGLLSFHIFAMFLSPFHFNTVPPGGRPAPDADAILPWFLPYINFMFLNHGYAFFAPDPPAASHLIRGTVSWNDDRPEVSQVFPDRKLHFPRLLYHRHFMLTEFLNGTYPPELPPEERDESLVLQRQQALLVYHQLRDSYANHLKVAHQADSATITRVEHRVIPYPTLLNEKWPLTDPRSYFDLTDDPVPSRSEKASAQTDNEVPEEAAQEIKPRRNTPSKGRLIKAPGKDLP